MIGVWLASLLALQPAPAELDRGEPVRTTLDNHLDRTWRALNEAGTHVCNEPAARNLYAPVWARFTSAMDAAEHALGRRPETGLYLNSCRRRGQWSAFNRSLRIAERRLRQAESLIAAGRTD